MCPRLVEALAIFGVTRRTRYGPIWELSVIGKETKTFEEGCSLGPRANKRVSSRGVSGLSGQTVSLTIWEGPKPHALGGGTRDKGGVGWQKRALRRTLQPHMLHPGIGRRTYRVPIGT